jgi:hypothetical protein
MTIIYAAISIASFAEIETQDSLYIRPYKRSDWGKWKDLDGDCLKTRDEVLKARSHYLPNIKDCEVYRGKWDDYYYDEIIRNAKRADVDHVVPLSHAHYAGAYKWTKKQRIKFYNDPNNLVITKASYNRKKGSLDITEWHPKDKEYACKYFKHWFKVKKKYRLKIRRKETRYYKKMNCN